MMSSRHYRVDLTGILIIRILEHLAGVRCIMLKCRTLCLLIIHKCALHYYKDCGVGPQGKYERFAVFVL